MSRYTDMPTPQYDDYPVEIETGTITRSGKWAPTPKEFDRYRAREIQLAEHNATLAGCFRPLAFACNKSIFTILREVLLCSDATILDLISARNLTLTDDDE